MSGGPLFARLVPAVSVSPGGWARFFVLGAAILDSTQFYVGLAVNIGTAVSVGLFVAWSLQRSANSIHNDVTSNVARMTQALNKLGSDVARMKKKLDDHHRDIGRVEGHLGLASVDRDRERTSDH